MRNNAYAQASAGVHGGSGEAYTDASRDGLCVANGCPLPGSLSLSTTGTNGQWFCALHLHAEPGRWGAISAMVNNRRTLFDIAYKLMRQVTGARVSEKILAEIRAIRPDIIGDHTACHALGMHIKTVLMNEARNPQQHTGSPARDYNPDV